MRNIAVIFVSGDRFMLDPDISGRFVQWQFVVLI